MMNGDFPSQLKPINACGLLPWRCEIARPTSVEPVNAILSTSGMFHQRFASRTVAGHNVDDSGGQSRFLAKVSESERSERREFSGLQHHGVSGSQSGSNLPCRHKQRKIPGNNLPNDTTRLVLRETLAREVAPSRHGSRSVAPRAEYRCHGFHELACRYPSSQGRRADGECFCTNRASAYR